MIELTEIHYETLWETIEVLQKDKLHMQKIHGELIDKIITLNEIIFDRSNDIIHLTDDIKEKDKLIKQLRKSNCEYQELLDHQEKEIEDLKGDKL